MPNCSSETWLSPSRNCAFAAAESPAVCQSDLLATALPRSMLKSKETDALRSASRQVGTAFSACRRPNDAGGYTRVQ